MEPRATLDFESRSAAPLRKTGSWRYSLDPTTEILCLAFRLPYWEDERTSLWHPAFPHLDMPESDNDDDVIELLEWIEAGGLVEAHNAWFERGIWTNILGPRHGWPLISSKAWRCSAAKAAAHALPRSLGDACSALRLSISKDAEGHKLMMKVSKPRKPRKAEREANVTGLLWWEDKATFLRLFDYCRTDVLAEANLSAVIPDLNVAETEIYLLDQTVNERGFQLDDEAVDIALGIIKRETVILTKELQKVTDGQVAKATQRAQMLSWFASEGLDLPDSQKATLDEAALDTSLVPKVRRGLELVRALGRSSTAKYQSMANWRCPDGRVRGGLLYHGAGTGRWSGAGVQPHNFIKGTESRMTILWDVLKTKNLKTIKLVCGDVMEALSNGLRGAIIAAPGHQLYVADYAAIEARCVLWLASDEDALGIFRRHEDIYKDMAADIYGIEMLEVTGDQRQHGKQAVLGCGYQMGWSKFQATCAKYGIIIDDETAQRIVSAYRSKYWRVVDQWTIQENAAIQATTTRKPVKAGYITWLREGDYLYAELPSRRRLAYPFPEIRARETPWGATKQALTFLGVNPYTRKWSRMTTYGGSLVENIVQAIARDLMAEAMLRCEKSGTYVPVLSVHDEMIAEAKIGTGSVAEFEALMAECPEWAEGCPVEAAGWTGIRYRK
jgi:Mesyanzhinovviridae DNA polymerase I